jgi:hypothetical protein
MGYRSEVAYTIRFLPPHELYLKSDENTLTAEEHQKKCEESFYTFIAEAKVRYDAALCFSEAEPINLKDGAEGFFIDEKNLRINFYAQHVKWYPDYADVKCHEALIGLSQAWADDGNLYIGGVSARVGEDIADNDESCWGTGDYDWLCVSRSICGDWL